MRVVVVAKPNTDYSRTVDTFLGDFTRQTGKELELLDPETREGQAFCETYDILAYPTIIALSDEGQVQNLWSGDILPTISEVSYYAA